MPDPVSAGAGRLRFPHPLVLLTACIILAAALSYILPAGQYQRREDPATGREVVVAGTYHHVEPAPVGPFAAMVAIPRGMADAASVIFLVFLIGGAFTVVERTGALNEGVHALARALQHSEILVIPVTCIAFAAAGALENMQEEIIAFVPVLLLLTRRLGFDELTAVAVSLGAAAVGAALSPVNPFQVQIAQKLAQLPLGSGAGFRLAALAIGLGIWIWGTMRYARRHRVAAEAPPAEAAATGGGRRLAVLLLVLLTFVVFVYGILGLGWDFDQMSALFFVMGVVAGLLGGLGAGGTADAFVAGFRSMAYAALLIGFARTISVVLQDGRIIDTIVQGMFAPIASLPRQLSALGIMAVEALLHVPVPSVSGEAVLTMPILVPLSDLLGLTRQVTVLAYQLGAGFCELITPTNGALMAILAAAGVGFGRWLRFVVPMLLALGLFAVALLLTAIAVGLR